MNITDIIGYIAGFLTATMMLPQIWKSLKSKNTEDLSVIMILLYFLAQFLWFWYAFQKSFNPVMMAATISMFFAIMQIFIKFKYQHGK